MRSGMIVFLTAWYAVLMSGHYWVEIVNRLALQQSIASMFAWDLLQDPLGSLFIVFLLVVLLFSGTILLSGVILLRKRFVNPGLLHSPNQPFASYFGARVWAILAQWWFPLVCLLSACVLALSVLYLSIRPFPLAYDGAEVEISGTLCPLVPSIAPKDTKQGSLQRVSFCIDHVYRPSDLKPFLSDNTLKLSCYYCKQELQANTRYRLLIKLKSKRPLLNFHDPWRWQKQWRLPWLAKGNVRKFIAIEPIESAMNQSVRIDDAELPPTFLFSSHFFHYLTQHFSPQVFRQRALEQANQLPHGASIAALLLGDRSGLTSAQWQHLSHVGLSHLLVISGLHIGFIIVLVLTIIRWILRFATRRFVVYASVPLVIATLIYYLHVINYGLPALRASVVAVLALVLLLNRLRLLPSTWWLLALLICSLADPYAFVSRGFWLSFLGVGILLLVFSHRPLQKLGKVRGLWRAQVAFFVGMTGVLLLFFEQAPSAPVISNLLAVPLVGLMLPLALLSALINLLSETLGGWLFGIVDILFSGFWLIVDISILLPVIQYANYVQVFAVLIIALSIPALLHFRLPFAPVFMPVALLGLMFGVKKPAPEFVITMLDVGQGLALILVAPSAAQTDPVTIIYDTGPGYIGSNTGWNAGSSVVLPNLAHLHHGNSGSGEPHMLVVSHYDNDHAGGLAAIVAQYPQLPVLAGQPDRLPGTLPCKAGAAFDVGSWQVELLWPLSNSGYSIANTDNNHSCVVKLSYRGISILIPGDLEADGQQALLDSMADAISRQRLRSDILVLPHHGSKNAFNPSFLSRVNPRMVLVSAGHKNAYGHPHGLFTRWFGHREIPLFNTGSVGAVEVTADFPDDSEVTWEAAYLTGMQSKEEQERPIPPEVLSDVVLRVRTASQPFHSERIE